MQPIEVRQLKLAKIDFNITFTLMQFVLLMLAMSYMYRSIEAFLYVIALIALLILAAFVLFLVIFFAMVPVMMHIRRKQGRYGVVARVQEAEGWAVLAVVVLQLLLFPFACKALLESQLVGHLWKTPPSLFQAYFTGSTISFLLFSVSTKLLFKGNLFGSESRFRWNA